MATPLEIESTVEVEIDLEQEETSSSQAGRVARGAIASRVIVVLVMAASLAVGLLPGGQTAQRAMQVAATAAGRGARARRPRRIRQEL